MDYSKMTKAELIEQLEAQPKVDDKELNQLKHQNEIFMKGVREKDAVITKLKEDIADMQQQQGRVFAEVEAQTNQKISTLSAQNVAIAKEFKNMEEGLTRFVEVTDDLVAYSDVAHTTIKNLVKHLKATYTEEE